MKKFGYTLMEVLIAMGIIGVVAAISAPILSNLVPDKDKIAVLKAYKIITDTNNEILENTEWMVNGPNNCVGLECISAPTYVTEDNVRRQSTPIEWTYPYEELFARNLDIEGNVVHNAEVGTTFDTTDGTRWFINKLGSEYIITIDVMDDKKAHSVFNANNTKPGQFSFAVNTRGTVWGNDPLTSAFLANPNKLNDRTNDRRTAENDNTTYKAIKSN